jgi:hypothetical protein
MHVFKFAGLSAPGGAEYLVLVQKTEHLVNLLQPVGTGKLHERPFQPFYFLFIMCIVKSEAVSVSGVTFLGNFLWDSTVCFVLLGVWHENRGQRWTFENDYFYSY